MLFLYRPRQTWLPYRNPRGGSEQAQYNRRLQERFAATQRVPPQSPSSTPSASWRPRDEVAALKELAQLHAAGSLSDAEFATAKARLLGNLGPTS